MDEVRKRIDETLAQARREVDELRVKAHLAKLEAHDEWRAIETKLGKLEAKTKELAGASAESAKDIGAAVKLLGEELRNGVKNFAKHL